MNIYFLRHVKTFNNINNILSGRFETDIIPNQTILIGDSNICFDIVYSSTAKRCIDTLQLLPNYYLNTDIIYTNDLLERSIGILENIPRDVAKKKYPEFFVNGKLKVDSIIPYGETIADVIQRTSSLTNKIMNTSGEINILICSHNQTLKIMHAMIKNISITNEYWNSKNFDHGTITKIL